MIFLGNGMYTVLISLIVMAISLSALPACGEKAPGPS